MQHMDNDWRERPVRHAFAREDRRAAHYKAQYMKFAKILFNLPAEPTPDNLIYEWQITHHDVYAVNKEDQKDGLLISIHPLEGILQVQAYKDGELLCNIDTAQLLELVCPC